MLETEKTSPVLNTFYDELNRLLQCYHDIIPGLKEELEYVIREDTESLNTCLNSLQVPLLQARGFDGMLARTLSSLGITANTLSEMISQLPDNEQPRFYSMLKQFEKTFRQIDFYSSKCKLLLETRLDSIHRFHTQQPVPKAMTLYKGDATGEAISASKLSFVKTI